MSLSCASRTPPPPDSLRGVWVHRENADTRSDGQFGADASAHERAVVRAEPRAVARADLGTDFASIIVAVDGADLGSVPGSVVCAGALTNVDTKCAAHFQPDAPAVAFADWFAHVVAVNGAWLV